MDMDLLHGPRHSSTRKSFNGCWTCRLRRKKCDERHPVCDACNALHITCHYDQDKPEWMDGGVRQEEMAERLKHEVKEKGYRRHGQRAVNISGNQVSVGEATTGTGELIVLLPSKPARDLATPDINNNGMEPCPEASTIRHQRGADCTLTSKTSHESGRAWILEMMISSPVVRQATLCQSSYFFSLARGTVNHDVAWETVVTQTTDAFGVLRQALQVIDSSSITEHLHGAVRIMTSIMQVQRFEIAVLSFNNCQAHLNAALALFRQVLDSSGAVEPAGPSSSFNAVISRLGPSSLTLPAQCVQVQSAEQAAFRFSTTLLILDDIIASTVLQEQPRLYEYHHSLLGDIDNTDPAINLEVVVGCQNWALLQISEIAVLDAWKQQCKRAGNLDVMELVHRAIAIKDLLETHLTRLETDPVIIPKDGSSLLDIFTADYCQQSKTPASQSSLVTRVWAHAALLYLFVVVSGWQPASVDVRYHVGRIVELLTCQISSPALLRTMVSPFCVAGCLAEPVQEAHLRGLVEALQPPSIFGTVRKALDIMENVWHNRDSGDAASRDLATCFRSQGDLVLLV